MDMAYHSYSVIIKFLIVEKKYVFLGTGITPITAHAD